MVILLDLDGVLVTTPAWQPVPLAADGFFQFNPQATANLAGLLAATNAGIVLTTSHRINYSLAEWQTFFAARGIRPAFLAKLNDRQTLPGAGSRANEIETWANEHGATENYVILDDDLSLHGLPAAIKQRCVITKPLIGLDVEAARQALNILQANLAYPT